jgi:hypothetical protein
MSIEEIGKLILELTEDGASPHEIVRELKSRGVTKAEVEEVAARAVPH